MMQSSDCWSDNAMPWDTSDNDWQDSHLNGMLDFMGTMNGGSESHMWHKQSADDSYADSHATFGQWQPGSVGFHTLRDSEGGYNGQMRARASQSQDFKPARPPPSFAALRKLQGDDGSDDSETETSAPGSTMMAPTDSSEDDAKVGRAPTKTEPNSLSRAAMVGREATQAECEEAERVVRTAFHDVKVRDRMRSKVSTASPTDLQAMLNARLSNR